MNKDRKLLTVCLITYNHEKYVEEAIKSILMQQADFEFDVVIADDCSTDNTRNILLQYKQQFPDKIHLILQEKNVGPGKNWLDLVYFPHSKYIAYLEGDDYWTDPYKLQKQVDYMEAHPDCVYTFHKVNELIKDKLEIDSTNDTNQQMFDLEELMYKNVTHSPALVYRNPAVPFFPSFFSELIPGDHCLQLLLLKDGGYAYGFLDYMAVYRKHDQGMWSVDKGKRFQLQAAVSYLRLFNYCHIKSKRACISLADYVTENGFKNISIVKYYQLIGKHLSVRDCFSWKNKYIVYPWIYRLTKSKK